MNNEWPRPTQKGRVGILGSGIKPEQVVECGQKHERKHALIGRAIMLNPLAWTVGESGTMSALARSVHKGFWNCNLARADQHAHN
jgi:hypothetical protein